MEAAAARVERVVIESFSEHTFFATVTLVASGSSHDLDARPSDALDIAMRMGAAVFVDQRVMADHGVGSLTEMESRLLATVEARIRGASPSTDPEKSSPAELLGGSGEWQSLIERIRSHSPPDHPQEK